MNPSQLIAWLVCLVLAAFAAVLSINNSYREAVLERRFAEVQKAAGEQTALLEGIRSLLQQIEADLQQGPAGKPAAAAKAPATEVPAAP